jgi:hypothetical protein
MAKKKKAKARKKTRKLARKRPVAAKKTRAERKLDEGLRETFPASDSVAVTDPTRSIKE